jgi:hypothetical protein
MGVAGKNMKSRQSCLNFFSGKAENIECDWEGLANQL